MCALPKWKIHPVWQLLLCLSCDHSGSMNTCEHGRLSARFYGAKARRNRNITGPRSHSGDNEQESILREIVWCNVIPAPAHFYFLLTIGVGLDGTPDDTWHFVLNMCLIFLIPFSCSSEKSQLKWSRHRLETDVCVAGNQAADPDVIQSYVKRVSALSSVIPRNFVCLQLVKTGGRKMFLLYFAASALYTCHPGLNICSILFSVAVLKGYCVKWLWYRNSQIAISENSPWRSFTILHTSPFLVSQLQQNKQIHRRCN